MKNIPNFMIIGAMKCGTTSLYHYLTAHPQVVPAKKKEIHFFDWNFEKGVDWYLQHFDLERNKNYITGEGTVGYLYQFYVPQRLYATFPKTKLIVLLRNPVERTISDYYMRVRSKQEYLSLPEALMQEDKRRESQPFTEQSSGNHLNIFAHYSYLKPGLYVDQLQRWMQIFPREQFLILRSEDLFANPDIAVNQVFKFLGLPEHHLSEYPQHRAGKYSPVSPEIREALAEYFRPYNQQLEQYLGRNFYWDTDWDTESSPVKMTDPDQAKQELHRKLTALSQVPQTLIDAEIAPWRAWLEFPRSTSGQKKPNILLLMSDQHREDAMGCSGGWVKTPNLDRIAAEGIRFSNCITPSPVCIPARIGLITGLYPHQTGIWKNVPYTLPPDRFTWIKSLRAAGYRMSLFGKTHWYPQNHILPDSLELLPAYGFDDFIEVAGLHGNANSQNLMTQEWQALGLWEVYKEDMAQRRNHKQTVRPSPLGLEHYYDVWVARQACQYLANYNHDQPWFCWVSFPGPHEPWDAPEPYASMYDPRDMPAPAPIPHSDPNRPQGQLDRLFAQWRGKLEEDDPAKLRANYAGNVTLIDHQIGKILELIQRRGELDNTIIVYISDHGEMNGDCGLLLKKNFMQGAVRVPLLIRTPETFNSTLAGYTYSHPVELLDLGPTLVDLVGATLDIEQSGKSLVPVLRNPQQLHRQDALSEFDQEVMLQSDRWKVALNQQGQVYLLFDLENDPEETINLANRADLAQIATELRAQCLARSGQQVQ